MTVLKKGIPAGQFSGASGDTKPKQSTYLSNTQPHSVASGSTFYELDTGIMWITGDGETWVEKDTIVRLETSPSIDIGDVTLLAGTAIVGKVNIKRVPVITSTTGTNTAIASLTPAAAFQLLGVRFNVSTGAPLAAAETLTVTLDAGDGAAYDTILFSQDLGTAGIVDVVIPFGGEEDFFEAADIIVIALSANAGGDTWGCQTVHELV